MSDAGRAKHLGISPESKISTGNMQWVISRSFEPTDNHMLSGDSSQLQHLRLEREKQTDKALHTTPAQGLELGSSGARLALELCRDQSSFHWMSRCWSLRRSAPGELRPSEWRQAKPMSHSAGRELTTGDRPRNVAAVPAAARPRPASCPAPQNSRAPTQRAPDPLSWPVASVERQGQPFGLS